MESLEIEMDCTVCGRYSTAAICPACQSGSKPERSPGDAIVDAVDTLESQLSAIATAGAANAAVQGIGSMAGGQLGGVGFTSRDGYIQAIRNGVPLHTHAEYCIQLRTRFGMTTADLAGLPGPMELTALPNGPGIKHVPTGPSVFDRPRSERAFVVGPPAAQNLDAPVSVKLEHGTLIAGATAEGHGVLVGWSGKGKLTRGALVEALGTIPGHGVKPPVATSARAQAGRVMSSLTGLGYVVRIARAGTVADNGTMWTVGKVNHRSAVGAELGSVELRATLHANGTLSTEGSEALGAKVAADYLALVADEIYQAGDVTGWLGRTLAVAYDAVRFGVGWYVPARHAHAAGELCATVAKIWGTDWIVPALPVATSNQLRDGIVRGLTSEVDALMERLATERTTAQTEYEDRVATHRASQTDLTRGHGDIGPKRGQTFLTELRAIGQRIVAYGQVLGEERLASAQEQVRQAVIQLETVLGDDYSGISARFGAVWEEIELDRKRSGGLL